MSIGGLGNSSSETSNRFYYSDSRLAASDNARIQDLRAGGRNSRLIAATSPYSVAGTGNTVNFTDSGAFDLVGKIVGVQSAALADISGAGFNAVQSATDQLAALGQTKVTDGANLNQRTTIVALVVFGLMGLLAWLYLRKR